MVLIFFKSFLLILISIIVYHHNKKFFLGKRIDIEPHQKFSVNNLANPIGGYILIFFIIIFNFYFTIIQQAFLFCIFVLGILSDNKILNSPRARFLIQIIIIISYLLIDQSQIKDSRVIFFDKFLEFKLFNIFFTSFCILILINGTNFIDGMNGLVLGYYILVSTILLNMDINLSVKFLEYFRFLLISLLLLNIFNKIFLGDNGSYLLGFIFSIIGISLSNKYYQISPYFIILLFWYPCFENLFSIIRKKLQKISFVYPDNDHLHQLLFKYLSLNKMGIKNKLHLNNFTSLIILIFQIPFFIIGSMYFNKTNVQIILIFSAVFCYVIAYLLLSSLSKKN